MLYLSACSCITSEASNTLKTEEITHSLRSFVIRITFSRVKVKYKMARKQGLVYKYLTDKGFGLCKSCVKPS